MDRRYLDATAACRALGIRPQTLYAYVSRGLVRSEPASGRSRARRYHREDVEALARRKTLRADPAQAARGALRVGEPVLESGLTLITEDALYYRGVDAAGLAREHAIEDVAALLWGGRLGEVEALRTPVPPLATVGGRSVTQVTGRGLQPLQRMQALLPLAAFHDVAAVDLQPASVRRTGWRIHHLLAAVACGRDVEADEGGSISRALQEAWLPGDVWAQRLLDAALILCADHELNVSAFTARCVASSGANLYAVVQAALSALQGFRHGGATQRVEALWREVEAQGDVRVALTRRLERGDTVPGFGHAVYRGTDPRAALLLELLDWHFPGHAAVRTAAELRRVVADINGQACNIDLALVTLRRAAGLPEGSALVLFALGRVVGWIAHALEQYETGELIRPRASYTGVLPEAAGG